MSVRIRYHHHDSASILDHSEGRKQVTNWLHLFISVCSSLPYSSLPSSHSICQSLTCHLHFTLPLSNNSDSVQSTFSISCEGVYPRMFVVCILIQSHMREAAPLQTRPADASTCRTSCSRLLIMYSPSLELNKRIGWDNVRLWLLIDSMVVTAAPGPSRPTGACRQRWWLVTSCCVEMLIITHHSLSHTEPTKKWILKS